MLRFGHVDFFESGLEPKKYLYAFSSFHLSKTSATRGQTRAVDDVMFTLKHLVSKSHVRRQRSDNATSTTTNLFGEQRKHNHESCFGFLNPANFSEPLCRSNGSDHMHPLDCPWPTFPSDEDHLRLSIFFFKTQMDYLVGSQPIFFECLYIVIIRHLQLQASVLHAPNLKSTGGKNNPDRC